MFPFSGTRDAPAARAWCVADAKQNTPSWVEGSKMGVEMPRYSMFELPLNALQRGRCVLAQQNQRDCQARVLPL